jgi:hypothetical protein
MGQHVPHMVYYTFREKFKFTQKEKKRKKKKKKRKKKDLISVENSLTPGKRIEIKRKSEIARATSLGSSRSFDSLYNVHAYIKLNLSVYKI